MALRRSSGGLSIDRQRRDFYGLNFIYTVTIAAAATTSPRDFFAETAKLSPRPAIEILNRQMPIFSSDGMILNRTETSSAAASARSSGAGENRRDRNIGCGGGLDSRWCGLNTLQVIHQALASLKAVRDTGDGYRLPYTSGGLR
ncbi:MAG: hypothetical protein U5R30_03660 [Deltaproteobacteria bacterium]|nr:hypothetical protein [Deltaproteobacteria bacterium]